MSAMQSLLRVFLVFTAVPGLCSAQDEEQQVKGSVGQAVTFNAQVLQRGFLSHGNDNIAVVINGKSSTDFVERFKGRVSWDSQTGLFKITELNTQDSGNYKVQNNDGQETVTVNFKLTVTGNSPGEISAGAIAGIVLAVLAVIGGVIGGVVYSQSKAA